MAVHMLVMTASGSKAFDDALIAHGFQPEIMIDYKDRSEAAGRTFRTAAANDHFDDQYSFACSRLHRDQDVRYGGAEKCHIAISFCL
jgi:hypothetical protein